VQQYIEPLQQLGIHMDEFAARLGSYPPQSPFLRPAWGVATVLSRLPAVAMSHRYDVTLLQREMVSTLATLEPLTRRPRLWDVDDAIWLDSRGSAIEKVARRCDGVICGNSYIADWAAGHNANIEVLPTAVNTERFRPGTAKKPGAPVVIGWMGQSAGYQYVEMMGEAIRQVCGKHRNVTFRVVSDAPPSRRLSHSGDVEFVKWSAESEVRLVQDFDIGIMPLEASPWCFGKCSYKMLLFMSCGVPVVVSDVGMNREVLRMGRVGYGVRNTDEWIQALECLIEHRTQAAEMGQAGRQVVQRHYSLEVLAPRFAALLGARLPEMDGMQQQGGLG
jgi:glycosyltransferase involved in cell wall biosynthesis